MPPSRAGRPKAGQRSKKRRGRWPGSFFGSTKRASPLAQLCPDRRAAQQETGAAGETHPRSPTSDCRRHGDRQALPQRPGKRVRRADDRPLPEAPAPPHPRQALGRLGRVDGPSRAGGARVSGGAGCQRPTALGAVTGLRAGPQSGRRIVDLSQVGRAAEPLLSCTRLAVGWADVRVGARPSSPAGDPRIHQAGWLCHGLAGRAKISNSNPGDLRIDRSNAGVPPLFPVAVAIPGGVSRPFLEGSFELQEDFLCHLLAPKRGCLQEGCQQPWRIVLAQQIVNCHPQWAGRGMVLILVYVEASEKNRTQPRLPGDYTRRGCFKRYVDSSRIRTSPCFTRMWRVAANAHHDVRV